MPPELAAILIQARRANRRIGVAGLLQYRNGHYFQILEGPSPVIGDLFARIRNDQRHRSISLITNEQGCLRRMFAEPGLALVSGKMFDPRIASHFKKHADRVQTLEPAVIEMLRNFAPGLAAGKRSRPARQQQPGTLTQYHLRATPLRISDLDQLPARMTVLSHILKTWASVEQTARAHGLDNDFVRETFEHRLVTPFLESRQVENDDAADAPSVTGRGLTSQNSARERIQSFFQRFF